jgi:hypothetical protein
MDRFGKDRSSTASQSRFLLSRVKAGKSSTWGGQVSADLVFETTSLHGTRLKAPAAPVRIKKLRLEKSILFTVCVIIETKATA